MNEEPWQVIADSSVDENLDNGVLNIQLVFTPSPKFLERLRRFQNNEYPRDKAMEKEIFLDE